MKNTIRLLFAAILLPASFAAHSAVLDFEDLTLGGTYIVGDSFVTSGVTVLANDFFFSDDTRYSGGRANVVNTGLAGGSGNELEINNINLDFNFGGPIPGLDLMFGEYGGNLNININGILSNFENFIDINGTIIAGVSVAVVNGLGDDIGTLSLTGNINSFALGGQELYIDNVSVIPIPAALWLFVTGLIGLIGYGKRRTAS